MTEETKSVQTLREEIFVKFYREYCALRREDECTFEESHFVKKCRFPADCNHKTLKQLDKAMDLIQSHIFANYIFRKQVAFQQAQYEKKIKEGIKKAAEKVRDIVYMRNKVDELLEAKTVEKIEKIGIDHRGVGERQIEQIIQEAISPSIPRRARGKQGSGQGKEKEKP